MYTTVDETGRLNNYATEPPVYLATSPSVEQRKTYLVQGGLAAAFVTALTVFAALVS